MCIYAILYSGWIPSDKIWDYFQKKDEYSKKNGTLTFQTAIKEIEKAISDKEKTQSRIQPEYKLGSFPVTIKNWKICDIINTFDENKEQLECIFNQRKFQFDRFNEGNGYDYLTVLWRIITPVQQQSMYCRILENCVQNRKEYLQNPRVCGDEFCWQ